MRITRGLVIADPWIDHILEGRKDWEMRSQPTAIRGWFGLIRKGSGQVVGLARLVDCGKALDQAAMIDSIPHHRIPETMIRRGEVAKWVVPWKLDDIVPLAEPVPCEHRSGAVTWVAFAPEVTDRLERYRHEASERTMAPELPPARKLEQVASLSPDSIPVVESPITPRPLAKPIGSLDEGKHRIIGRSRLSGGNIRNDHINLSIFLDAFPADVIGGKNKDDVAPRQIVIDWGGPQPVATDIDGTKSIFRKRGWVRRFFASSGAQEDDVVIITETAPYRISVRLERQAPEVAKDAG